MCFREALWQRKKGRSAGAGAAAWQGRGGGEVSKVAGLFIGNICGCACAEVTGRENGQLAQVLRPGMAQQRTRD